jgi:YaiO family outer membrane protein
VKRYQYLLCNPILFFFLGFVPVTAMADINTAYKGDYHTGISPALETLLDQSLRQKQYKKSLLLLDNELKKDPINTDLLYKKASIEADLGEWKKTIEVLNQISLVQPKHIAANKLRDIIIGKQRVEPHNILGFDQSGAVISDRHAYWSYSSLYYYRLTDAGKFGARVNYAHRNGTSAEQYQLEAYPQLFKGAYADLRFAYANTNQILFPSYQYRLEGYFELPYAMTFSLGHGSDIFPRFNNKKIYSYTTSLGKYIGDYFVWVRMNHYLPQSIQFYELGLRRDFSDGLTYINFKINAGRLPDIGDVPPLDKLIQIKQKGVSLDGQIPLTKTLFFKWRVGFARQIFPSGTVRNITDGMVGVAWNF